MGRTAALKEGAPGASSSLSFAFCRQDHFPSSTHPVSSAAMRIWNSGTQEIKSSRKKAQEAQGKGQTKGGYGLVLLCAFCGSLRLCGEYCLEAVPWRNNASIAD
jgi:hypothetical protein